VTDAPPEMTSRLPADTLQVRVSRFSVGPASAGTLATAKLSKQQKPGAILIMSCSLCGLLWIL
jgi:hypothetical protein